MTQLKKLRTASVAVALGFIVAGADFDMLAIPGLVPGEADARVGRPLTPGSVAGVARRSSRRQIRRSAVYAASLPTNCVRENIDGYDLYSCGGTYYQQHNGQYVVVYLE